ncbi:Integrase catalytic domain-containing protein [Erysipelothrix urinaevulpis]
MCKILEISRSGYYKYRDKDFSRKKDIHTDLVIKIFHESNRIYGTRKIKNACEDQGITLSRRRIGRIMTEEGLVSRYTVVQFKPQRQNVNREQIMNIVNQEFNGRKQKEVIVSDLTYVRVGSTWYYICVIVDLFNREVICYSAGTRKTAQLVKEAFATVKGNLSNVQCFHSDRGMEFKNSLIEDLIDTFGISRSLSEAGVPYDNAVAEATFKSIKTEFVYPNRFETLQQLKQELSVYVWWFNNKRYHQTLNYLTPVQYRLENVI